MSSSSSRAGLATECSSFFRQICNSRADIAPATGFSEVVDVDESADGGWGPFGATDAVGDSIASVGAPRGAVKRPRKKIPMAESKQAKKRPDENGSDMVATVTRSGVFDSSVRGTLR